MVSAAIAVSVFLISISLFDSRRNYQDLLDICGFATTMHTSFYLIVLMSAIYLSWLAIDFGASYIAPLAENRATPRRLIALLLMLITSGVFLFTPPNLIDILPVIIVLLAIPVCVISLTEASFLVPNISASFISRGALIRKSRYLLYPGWQSGIWYCILLYFITIGTIFFLPDHDQALFLTITTTFSWLLFPLAITKLFFNRFQNLFTIYVAVLLVSAVLFLVTISVISITNTKGITLFLCWLPPVQFYLIIDAKSSFYSSRSSGYSYEFILALSIISLAINWAICLIRSFPEWNAIRKNENAAKSILANISKD